MNDIEVLKNLIQNLRNDFVIKGTMEWNPRETYAQALENIVQENTMLKKVNNITENITVEEIENAINEASKEYIPISLIKEKIEEKQKRIDKMHPASDCVLIDDLETQIQVLEELLKTHYKNV